MRDVPAATEGATRLPRRSRRRQVRLHRGRLRIYLGMAAGVGKTYAMLNEGQRRKSRGPDVVIGYVETHNRPLTAAQIGDLEIIPRRPVTYRGVTLEEMDLDALLHRHPQVALVDELAHTNAPGSRNAKRYQDVEELLAAGVTVISTLNIQHLEGLNDLVEAITGVRQRETVPDRVLDEADEVELVDIAPEALNRGCAMATSIRRSGPSARWQTTFRRATSPPCAIWRSAVSPKRPRRNWKGSWKSRPNAIRAPRERPRPNW